MATLNDAATLSRIHAETWEDTYAGQVPDALAREGMARARARDWTEHLGLRARAGGGVVVLIEAQHVVGFCEFGPTEDAGDDPQHVGHMRRSCPQTGFETALSMVSHVAVNVEAPVFSEP